jgi:putative ABC transport system permease protein
VATFAMAAGMASAVLFGLAPAFQVAKRRRHGGRIRHILIAAQVAASCVLLVVAGLLTRAVNHMMFTSPGFDYEHVLSISPNLGSHSYSPAKARAYLDTLQQRVRQLPGVESVALVAIAPLGNAVAITDTEVAGHQLAMHVNRIDGEYFQTMQIPVLRGRTLTTGDTTGIMLSASAAARAWPGEDPIGKILPIGEDDHGAPTAYTVVGIAGNARVVALENPDAVEVYFPLIADEIASMNVVVRSAAPTESLAPAVTAIARSLDPDIFPQVQVLKSAYHRKLDAAERGAMGASLLGLSALLIACLGIVGLVAYAVSQRIKEIGIRIALGAARGHVLLLVLRQFSRPVAVGLVLGLAGAAALSQILRRQLYGISSLDPAAYLAATAIFVVTVALAALLPARRALRIDPVKALRCD